MEHTTSSTRADSETGRVHDPPKYQYPPISQRQEKIWMKTVKLHINCTQRNKTTNSKFPQLTKQLRTWKFKYSGMWCCARGWVALYSHNTVSRPRILDLQQHHCENTNLTSKNLSIEESTGLSKYYFHSHDKLHVKHLLQYTSDFKKQLYFLCSISLQTYSP